MKKLLATNAALLIAAGSLTGCGGGEETKEKEVVAPTPEAAVPEPAVPPTPNVPNNVPMSTGFSAEAQEKMIEAAAAQAGMDADVEFNSDGGMTFKGSDEEHGEISVAYGSGAKMPDNLPKDVPVYEGLALTMVNEVAAEEVLMIMGTSGDGIDTIASYYKEQADSQGWTLSAENQVPGMAHTLMYEKDDRMMQVVLGPAPTGGTQVTLNTGKK